MYVCTFFYFQGRNRTNYGEIECILCVFIILYGALSSFVLVYGPIKVAEQLEELFLMFECYEKPLSDERLENSVSGHLFYDRLS